MRAVDIIIKKRDGGELTGQEIGFFVQGFTRGEIPDYQASAWLMAILWRGMSKREITDLTLAMVNSGETLDLSAVAPWVVDKHSSGGVGDKTTLVVEPIAAALGMPVAKMSGRGLSFSGGTLDKMESIRGYNVNLTREQFLENLRRYGIVLCGQTANLAPADGKFYALRDVTGTVDSIPLIASSIMSKKIAAGANAIVLDVKVGRGAFMKTLPEAAALAQTMIEIGRGIGRKVTVALSNMDQPLGQTVGNALEVQEAIATLKGAGGADFREHCEVIAAEMLLLGDKSADPNKAREMARQAIRSGQALAKFRTLVQAQGGDIGMVDNPEKLPRAALVETVNAPREGHIAALDAMIIGLTAVDLGAGRAKKDDPVDHSVGLILHKKIGESVRAGEALFTIHANDASKLAAARSRALTAYSWSDQPVNPPPLIYQILREGG
jgi:pyrimidine-nucleoside phosphorylase